MRRLRMQHKLGWFALLSVAGLALPTVASAGSSSRVTEAAAVSVIAGTINEVAADQYPASFGDIKIDDAGDITVYVVGHDQGLMSFINSKTGSTIGVDYVQVRYSAHDLRALAERVAANRSLLTPIGVSIVGLTPDAANGTVDVILQTPPSGVSTAATSNDVRAAQTVLDTRYGRGRLTVEQTTEDPGTLLSTCPSGCRTDDFSPFYGGDSVTFETPGYYNFCSTSFAVTDKNGDAAVLSAGHCAPSGVTVSINCAPPPALDYCPVRTLGKVGPSYYPPSDSIDYEAIDVSGSDGYVYGGSPTSTDPPMDRVTGSVMQASNTCCLTLDGAGTGEIQGNFIVTNWTCYAAEGNTICGLGEVYNNGNSNLGICQPGDSGSPVYEHDGSIILAEGSIDIGARSLDGKTFTRCYFEQMSAMTGGSGIKLRVG